ncbi:hypothetical protein DL768_002269 [Monosporascus sp. mg162]|nr:hypothetical protein DL768_002269 [Monosporascus sp. mg162]
MAGPLLLPRADASVELPEDGSSYRTCNSKGGDTQTRLLESVSAEVADALGVDPSELPQPFGGINPLPSHTSVVCSQSDDRHSYSSSVYSPTSDYHRSPRGSLIHERLAKAVADVLGLDVSQISRGDSFVELGGNLQKARELSANCIAVGLSVEPDVVLACRTIAELETLITPLTTSRTDIAPSPLVASLPSTNAIPRRPQDVAIQPQQSPSLPLKTPGRLPTIVERKPPQLEDEPQPRPRASSNHDEVEHILSLNSAISQVAVIKPKAGLFEGQTVVFLTLVGYSAGGAVNCEVHLQASHCDQLSPARKEVEARVSQNYAPKVWVALQQMPLDESGNINRRKLQTWIQNVHQDICEQIMSVNPQGNSTPPSTACEQHVSWRESGRVKEVFDLSPIQRLYFHTTMRNGPTQRSSYNDEHRFNQSVLLRLNKPADIEDVHAAVEAVVGHHPMLRCRFRPTKNSWCGWIEADISSSYEFSTHAVGTNDEVEEVIRIAQGMIDIEQGPVFAAKHFHTHDGYQMLYLVAHRLVIDFRSWGVITNDLDVLLTNGHLASGPSLSFSSWVAQQKRHAQALGVSGRSAFPISSSAWDYWGIQDDRNTYDNTAAASFTLSAGIVSMLGDKNQASKTHCADIFISALLLSFSRTFRDRLVPTLWNVEHERYQPPAALYCPSVRISALESVEPRYSKYALSLTKARPSSDLSIIDNPSTKAKSERGYEAARPCVAAIYPVTGSQESILNGESLIPRSSTAEVIYEFDTGNKHDASLVVLFEELERAYHVAVNSIQHALNIKGGGVFNTCMSLSCADVAEGFRSSNKFHHVRTKLSSEYDISVNVNLRFEKVSVNIAHRILNPSQAILVAHAFGRAIQTIIDSPASLVKQVDLFSEHDHKRILAWNSTSQPDTCDKPVHELIAVQASANPDIQAVCAWDGEFTYAELHKYSIALAGHLTMSGLKAQTLVPVIMDKSRWAVVAMLAVLYSNAVLIPVDAEATSLFSQVIEAVDANFVLASDSVRRYLNNAELEIIVVNEYTVPAMSAQAAAANLVKTTSTDLACILFGHGSPKSRKASAYNHGALAMACVGQGPALRICASSRVMQLSSYSVDIALSEILTTLIHGGCVCVPSASERLADFTGAAQRMNVNWTYLTPPLSRKLNPESLTGLAVVCFRQGIDIDTYMSWAGRAKVFVVYSPRRACPLGLSAFELEDARDIQCIGNPIRGNFWIVSPEERRRLMPVGAVGELVIMSPAIATDIRLKEAPFKGWARDIATTNSSGRGESDCPLLKTNQLVRYREGGRIELVSPDREAGRIKSNTVQHSEIESALRRCLGRGTNVAVDTITFGVAEAPPVIAAFIEVGDNWFQGNENLTKLSRVTKERLYLIKQKADTVLRGKLPTNMIPSAYIPVQHLPLTLSLEISRKDLRKLVTGLSRRELLSLAEIPGRVKAQGAELKPLSFAKVENQIRSIWANVLGVPETHIKNSDKFLSLGGDAVLAHKVAVACGEKDIVVSAVDVLRDLSLGELVRRITSTQTSTQSSNLSGQSSPSNTFSEDTDTTQFMDWERAQFEDVAEASSLQTLSVEAGSLRTPGNIDYFIINISGQVNQRRLENACSRLVEAHAILRTGFALRGRQIFQTVFPPQSFQPESQHHRSSDWRLNSLVTKLIKRDQSLPVDFRYPITKFMFIDGGKTTTMVLRLSKAQYDEASLPSLLGDLSRLYNHPDGALKRYPSFCDVVRAAQNQDMNSATEYWRSLLDGSTMAYVVSQPSPAIPTPGSKTIQQQIPISTMQSLGVPFETILNGAWSIVLSNLSGSEDVVFGQLVEGKSLRLAGGHSLADVVGPSGNIIAVRTRVPGNSIAPYEYLRCIQNQHAASMTHAHMQFADVMQDCTSWPAWTHFSTVVQHSEQDAREALKGFALGNAACKVSCLESNLQNSDIFIRSTMTGPANVNVSLTFCEKRVRQSIADEALKMLCSTVTLLTSEFVMKPLPFKVLNGINTTPKIPLPSAPRQGVHLKGPIGSIPLNHAQAINNVIEAAWQSVLDVHSPSLSDIRFVPFYEIWGSLMAAAELAGYYTEQIPGLNIPGLQHVEFAVEDIIDHPSMAHQYELIFSKRRGRHQRRHSSLFSPAVSSRPAERPRFASGDMASASRSVQTDDSSIPADHCPVSSSSSVESMTTGSSQSDKDEILDDAKLVGPARGSDKKIKQLLGVDLAKLPSGTRVVDGPMM